MDVMQGRASESILPDLIFLMIVELSCFYPTENRCNTSHTIGSLFISSSEELFCGSSSDVNSVLTSCLGICGIVETTFCHAYNLEKEIKFEATSSLAMLEEDPSPLAL